MVAKCDLIELCQAIVNDWVGLFNIPIEILVFPRIAQATGVDEQEHVSGMENRFKRQFLANIETTLT